MVRRPEDPKPILCPDMKSRPHSVCCLHFSCYCHLSAAEGSSVHGGGSVGFGGVESSSGPASSVTCGQACTLWGSLPL